jgi:hypothetical protein
MYQFDMETPVYFTLFIAVIYTWLTASRRGPKPR